MPTIPTAPAGQSFTALAARLAAAGFTPGAPPQVTLETRAIDRALCRRSRCSSCQACGLGYRPFARGPRYRVLAECARCGGAAELEAKGSGQTVSSSGRAGATSGLYGFGPAFFSSAATSAQSFSHSLRSASGSLASGS